MKDHNMNEVINLEAIKDIRANIQPEDLRRCGEAKGMINAVRL
jgi:hypothetical protein